MQNINFIKVLYDEITNRGASIERYKELTSDSRSTLYNKVISPISKNNKDFGFEVESIINDVISNEAYFYFEQGVKCAAKIIRECIEIW